MADLTVLKNRYDELTRNLKEAIPAVCNIIGNVQVVKQQVLDLIQRLNSLVLQNSALISRTNTAIQSRIRAIPSDVAYIGQPDIPLSELQDLRRTYAQIVRDILRFIELQNTSASSRFPALDRVQTAFRTLYNQVNLSRLDTRARDFVDQLYTYQANAIVVRNTDEAVTAYTNGLNVLASVLPDAVPTATVTESDQLKQTLQGFINEWNLRDLSRAISNDRLTLTDLRFGVPTIRGDLTSAQINSYMDAYRKGIQLLRLYPLK
jgi:hypothetical protein